MKIVKSFMNRRSLFRKAVLNKKAFSLIELSVVIVIFSIVIAGMLSISTNKYSSDAYRETQDNMKRVYQAMGAYLLKNGKLPCPAPITAIKGVDVVNDANNVPIVYGQTSGIGPSCSTATGVYYGDDSTTSDGQGQAGTGFIYGAVPVRDLGLSTDHAEDGFHSKLGYFVYQPATDSSSFSTAIPDDYGIDVEYNGTSLLGTSPTELAIFAIVSYGENKLGAFNTHLATQNTYSTDDAEEYNYMEAYDSNTSGTGAANFKGYTANELTLQSYAIGDTSEFDDFMFFKTRSNMIRDFNAFFLIKCIAEDSSMYGTTVSWSNAEYSEVSVSTTLCPVNYQATVVYPARRCGALGNWEDDSDDTAIAVPCGAE